MKVGDERSTFVVRIRDFERSALTGLGACFSKGPETFRAQRQILKSRPVVVNK